MDKSGRFVDANVGTHVNTTNYYNQAFQQPQGQSQPPPYSTAPNTVMYTTGPVIITNPPPPRFGR